MFMSEGKHHRSIKNQIINVLAHHPDMTDLVQERDCFNYLKLPHGGSWRQSARLSRGIKLLPGVQNCPLTVSTRCL